MTSIKSHRIATSTLVLASILMAVATFAPSQEGKTAAAARHSGLDSERQVSLKLTFSSRRDMLVRQREGSTILIQKGGSAYRIIPSVRDESRGLVTLDVTKYAERNDTEVEDSEKVELDMNSDATSRLLPGFSIQLQGIQRVPLMKYASRAEDCACSLGYQGLRICADCLDTGKVNCRGKACPSS